jgi:hypothetical protein
MPAISISGRASTGAGGYCAEGCAEDPTRGSSPRILEEQENEKNSCPEAEARVKKETSLRYIWSMVGGMEGGLTGCHSHSPVVGLVATALPSSRIKDIRDKSERWTFWLC